MSSDLIIIIRNINPVAIYKIEWSSVNCIAVKAAAKEKNVKVEKTVKIGLNDNIDRNIEII